MAKFHLTKTKAWRLKAHPSLYATGWDLLMLIAGGNVLGAAIQKSKLLDMVAGVLKRDRFNILLMRRTGGSHCVLHCLGLLAGMLDLLF
jgi:hypothetical protein